MVKYIAESDAIFASCRVLDKFGGCSMGPFCPDSGCREVREVFESVPAADVVERKKSKWEWSSAYGYYFCPECHSISPREDQDGNCIDCPNFCCECGADMRGES